MYQIQSLLLIGFLSTSMIAAQHYEVGKVTSPSESSAHLSPSRPGRSAAGLPDEAHLEAASTPPAGSIPSALSLHTHVDVHAQEQAGPSTMPPSTVEFTGREVLESAGTWSDLPRFLQTLPGLVSGSDTQNASFVRGGNPFENLFEVDRIEVPNINHLALANSTGGLGSMLDTEMVGTVTFQSGDVGSSHDSHLSSLTDIHTLETPGRNLTAYDIGYSGAGVRIGRPFGRDKNLLFSARESITNLFLHDVGLNGSPEFTNVFARYTVDLSSRNHVWLESLGGRDRLQVIPTWNDLWETNAYNTDYSGWRNTAGAVWQYTLKNDAVSTMTISNSENLQRLRQTSQLTDSPSSFQQDDHDGVSVLKYDYLYAGEDGSGSHFGADLHANRINYATAQSGNIWSPYSASTLPAPAFTLNPVFGTVDRAAFADVNEAIQRRLFVRGGVRYQKIGLASATGSTNAILPHASLSAVLGRISLSGSWNRTAQLPPFASVAGAPGNAALGLIHAQQFVTGVAFRLTNHLSMNLEAYRKTYVGYPVSIEYPQVSLATLLPVITEPFTTLALQSRGLGRARGLELSVTRAPWHGFFSRGNVSVSRSEFTGRDGVYRHGSNDLPVVVNVLAGMRARRFDITVRETATSGRPYTPVLSQASLEANRSIYDLSQLNAFRGPLYSRLDFALNRTVDIHGGALQLHAGLLNALNRKNFYEYLWRPRCPVCGPVEEYGTGLRPDFNVSYTF